jgi:predicted permease
MFHKIKSYLLIATTVLTFAAPVIVPSISASAACSNIGNQVSTGAAGAAGSAGTDLCGATGVGSGSISTLGSQVVNYFSIVVGAVAIIMIIYGGFRYITSGGDSNRVGSAKNTLIYAIVGLIIVALAQVIVHFVLNTTSTAVPTQ